MEFLFLTPGDVASLSGGSVYNRRLAAALDAAGHSVSLTGIPGTWPAADEADHAHLERVLSEATEPDRNVVERAQHPGHVVDQRRQGQSLGARTGGAVSLAVVIDGLIASAAPAALKRFTSDAPPHVVPVALVHLPLGVDPTLPAGSATERRAGEAAALGALSAAGLVVATSRWTAGRLGDLYGVDPNRVAVVEPGTDPAPLSTGSRPPRLLMVGSLSPLKQPRLLLAALAAVLAAGHRDWTAHIVGPDGPDAAHADIVRAEAAGLDGNVTVTGALTGPDLDAEYDSADLFVLPSQVETYGMAAADALARGVPVVTTAGTGAAELVGVAGTAVPTAGPHELAAVLAGWLGDPGTRRRWQKAVASRCDPANLARRDRTIRDRGGRR